MGFKYRNIAMSVVLSLITCGIYQLYWFVVITDDVASLGEDRTFTGMKSVLFTIITCGIYYFYWNYKMGELLCEAKQRRGEYSGDKSLLFLILALFGLSVINYAIIQDDLNRWAIEY